MAKAATLRTLSDDQLLDELEDARKELFNLRFAFATGQLDSSSQMSTTKRDIARIHTVLREREIAAADALTGLPQAAASPSARAGSSAVEETPQASASGDGVGNGADDSASTGDPQ